MSKTLTIESLIILVILAVGLTCPGGCKKKETAPARPSPVAEQPDQAAAPETEPVTTTEPEGPFDKLLGRWIRTGDGYVIEIRSVDSNGQLDADYFNPRPINVSVAKAAEKDGSVEVFLELRDVNYPGSNYALTYDPQRDVLVGSYFQAVQRQTFAIEFIRESMETR